MGVDERPRSREARVSAAVEEPHPRDDEGVVRPGVAELVPPVLADDLVRVDLVDGPELFVVLVKVDGLEDVLVEGDFRGELALVVCAVEAHFELGEVLRVHFDHVHGLEELLGKAETCGLVDARELLDGLLFVVEVFVVLLHVVAVPVGDGDVVCELGGAEHTLLTEGCCAGEDALCGVGPGTY